MAIAVWRGKYARRVTVRAARDALTAGERRVVIADDPAEDAGRLERRRDGHTYFFQIIFLTTI